jgi:hypothetical protein
MAVLRPGTVHVNFSPDVFRLWAGHYYKCKQDFTSPDPVSPVPYFLLCRAMELVIKAKHLEVKKQKHVKDEFGHDIIKAYKALPPALRILSGEEEKRLEAANKIYRGKGFEYFEPAHLLGGYAAFGDLATLDAIALRLLQAFGRPA